MPGVFGNALPFYPGPDDAPPTGGLLGLLLQAMQRQGLEVADLRTQANTASAGSPNGFGNPQSGPLGGLPMSQAGQDQAPIGGNRGLTPLQTPDPSFRQLLLASIANQPRPAIDPSDGPYGAPGQTPSPLGDSSSFSPPRTPGQSTKLPGSDNGKPATSWPMAPTTPQTIQAGWRSVGVGKAFPGPGPIPFGKSGSDPAQPPKIPAPAIPDAWRDLWTIFQLYPKFLSELPSTSSGGDRDCNEERRKMREICVEAYADGWKSVHDVGPYKDPWTIDDCMRGLVTERCGGNRVDKDR